MLRPSPMLTHRGGDSRFRGNDGPHTPPLHMVERGPGGEARPRPPAPLAAAPGPFHRRQRRGHSRAIAPHTIGDRACGYGRDRSLPPGRINNPGQDPMNMDRFTNRLRIERKVAG